MLVSLVLREWGVDWKSREVAFMSLLMFEGRNEV